MGLSTKKDPDNYHSWRVVWDILPALRESGCWYGDWDRIESAIWRLKYVEDVCFDHMCWVEFNFGTSSAKVAENRLKDRKEVILRLFNRYSSKEPPVDHLDG